MKTILPALLLLLTTCPSWPAEDLSRALQIGLFEEEANQDLEAAIRAYQQAVGGFDENRKLAATAVFRLGECYRKLGRIDDAVVQFQRVVREFGDQAALTVLARQKLSALDKSIGNAGGQGTASTDPAALGQLQLRMLDLSLALTKIRSNRETLERMSLEERRASVSSFSDDVPPFLARLLQNLAEEEQKQARLSAVYASRHPEIQSSKASISRLHSMVDEQIESVIAQMRLKEAATVEAVEAVATLLGTEPLRPSPAGPASAATDAEAEEIRRIQAMIKDSPDLINSPGGSQTTPLYHAAVNSQLGVARFLLAAGADPRVSSARNGMTALHAAALAGNKSMVELLLAHGADISAPTSGGETPLHLAAGSGFKAVVEVLLANKASVDAATGQGETPLHRAADGGFLAICSTLLDAGADPNRVLTQPTRWGPTAGEEHRYEPRPFGVPLHWAAYRGDLAMAQLLLARGAKAEARNVDGVTPLHVAAYAGTTNIASALLAAGASTEVTATSWAAGVEWTPLFLAVQQGNADMVELLLENGANPNRGCRYQNDDLVYSPLMAAMISGAVGRIETVRSLLEHKADPNFTADDGYSTALTWAVERERTEVVGLLLEAGAKVDPVDQAGRTPLFKAAKADTMKELLEAGADPNRRDSLGDTPLHFLIKNRASALRVPLARLLIGHGADVNIRNNDGLNPLNLYGIPARAEPGAEDAGMVMLLREQGAEDKLGEPAPDPSSIRVWRQGQPTARAVFLEDANGWNRYSLLETLCAFYTLRVDRPLTHPRRLSVRRLSTVPGVVVAQRPFSPAQAMPFPDLRRIRVLRRNADGANASFEVNLLDSTGVVDCSRDVELAFGDTVVIAEREHSLADPAVGLTGEQQTQIERCLGKKITFIVKGRTNLVENAELSKGVYLDSLLQWGEAKALLFSSSDLSRLKIRRTDRVTGESHEILVNVDETDPADALWIRDGDVIEVPEKPGEASEPRPEL